MQNEFTSHMAVKSLLSVVVMILCLLSIQTSAMEFTWRGDALLMAGEIQAGDSEKFRLFLRDNFAKYRKSRSIVLTSNGGNLIEALKIAAHLKSIYLTIILDRDCASACFFIYLSGVKRVPLLGRLGIHRAYFDPRYFENLDLEKARERQALLTRTINTILEENEIPQKLIEMMNQTPSSEMYWLSTTETMEWIKFSPTWYEEVLIARCDYGTYLNLKKQRTNVERESDESKRITKEIDKVLPQMKACEGSIVDEELAKYANKLPSKKK